jgi:hypothetical protein
VSIAPTTDLRLDSAYHYPLGGDRRFLVSSGTLPSGNPDTSVLYEYALTGSISGPVARGGAREFGWWAWAVRSLRLLIDAGLPDFSEVKEDLGRAFADLGAAQLSTYAAKFVEETDPTANQVRIRFDGDLPPNAEILAGVDFLVGAPELLPIRVVSVDEDLLATDQEVVLTLTDRPPTTVAAEDAVTLVETTIAQAWREIRDLTAFLDGAHAILDNLVPPVERVVSAAASRLDAAGFREAAAAVRSASFSKWLDTEALSSRTDLAETLETLVSSLLSRRRSPLEE